MLLVACGGGGDNQTPKNNNQLVNTSCPLGEININGVCRFAENICTAEGEKTWVRGYLDTVYLWYNEIQDVNATHYSTPRNYFDALLVKEKDQFSYTLSKAEAEGFFESGLQLSLGLLWAYDENYSLRVRFVEPNSLADQSGIKRGDYLTSINNQYISTLNEQQIADALYPTVNTAITLVLFDATTGNQKQITITGQNIVTSPVPYYTIISNPSTQQKIGYLLFNDHIATASDKLIEAVNTFKTQKINDLVLDLRFNSGGYIYIANELAAMIGGQKTQNKLFQSYVYNNKYAPDYYYFEQQSYPSNTLLPHLNLSRLFVLTTPETCSASEAIINNLSPFMPVIKIGSQTCGKPYGMEGANNCDTAYFAITFKGENAYAQSVPTTGYTPNCEAYETLNHPLGSIEEGLLANALYYQQTGRCMTNNAIQSKKMVNTAYLRPLSKPLWQQNMLKKDSK